VLFDVAAVVDVHSTEGALLVATVRILRKRQNGDVDSGDIDTVAGEQAEWPQPTSSPSSAALELAGLFTKPVERGIVGQCAGHVGLLSWARRLRGRAEKTAASARIAWIRVKNHVL
jgi:hypothetical protein